MNSPAVELPLYQCHKQVRAAKIEDMRLSTTEGRTTLVFGDSSVEVFDMWCDKHKVEIGGYYVQYRDGYTSYSPAQAFEEGYTRIPADYRDRVRQEHAALEDNIDRLELFLNKNSPQPNCPPDVQVTLHDFTLLNLQLNAMRLYAHILTQRIDTF